jgi:hypothetical protein
MTLSKTDFKIASSCSKKLIYKKNLYITLDDEDEYSKMLAQGGHIVGKYAQKMYPDGIEIESNSIKGAIDETKRLLNQNKNITLFEATILSNEKIVKVDILEKRDKILNLIEVKSKSHDSEDDTYNAKRKLKEYIEDVAFQAMVLKEALNDYEIHSYLLLPDKAKRTTIEGLTGWFKVKEIIDEKNEIEELPAQNTFNLKKPHVEFKFEKFPNNDEYLNNLRKDNLLTLVPVDLEIENIKNEIQRRSDTFIDILHNGIKPEHFSINKNCRDCEFNLGKEKDKNGFRECWKELADIEPNIFDLYFGGGIGHHKSGWYFDELISQGKVSFWDIDTNRFKTQKGELSSRGQRQIRQFQNTKSNNEWISSELSTILKKLKYPLHFIDFETYKGAIPPHRGMRPYELVAFQWSCHTLNNPESEPVHSEWLNCDNVFPNFLFAESLMNQIGNPGTPLMWASFENTVLRDILEQMEIFEYSNDILKEWLFNITSDKDREGRLLDMNKITLDCYFHPDMKGRTSIKNVLPAIWKNNPYLHSKPWFKKYAPDSIENLNPYDTLAPVQSVLGTDEVIKFGTDAMRAYHELLFGSLSENDKRKEELKKLLLQYCELDTMAMVIIWKYWMDKCKLIN